MADRSSARVYEQDIRIPTYHIREDPNPPLYGFTEPWVYPYPKQDEMLRPPDQDYAYREVVLENDYLKVEVLPQLGGKLFAAYDKAAGRDIFYRVPVIKPALIGLRGAWMCGGIEFNFVKGHHVMTVSPVDHITRENPDGSVSVTVGHMERRSRARWNVTITLHPERAYIQTDLKLYNRYRYPLDFYQWSNSAIVASEDLVLPYPTDFMVSSGRDVYRYPRHGGADLGRWTTIPVAHDLFSIGREKGFFGVYYENADMGMVHYANPYQSPGAKMFTWGQDHAGRIWDQLLTDTDTAYIEPQAGAVVDQSTFLFLQPHQTVQWREYWWGVRGMGGFVEVNQHAALNMAPKGHTKTLLAVNATSALEGCRLSLAIEGRQVFETRLDVSPNAPFDTTIDLPHADWQYRAADLLLTDAAGREVIHYHKPAPNMFVETTVPHPFTIDVDARSSAEEHCIAAVEQEKLRRYDLAEASYDKALQIDPEYSTALAGLGALYSRQGLYEKAYALLARAVTRNPDNWTAHYHLGIVCRELGDLKSARTHFWAVRLDPAHNAQAFYYLAEMAIEQSSWQPAEELLRRSIDLNRLHVKAHDMLALVLRMQGKAAAAEEVLDAVLADVDPTDVLAHAERWCAAPNAQSEARLLARIGGDAQVLIELACDYGAVGQYRQAVALLELWSSASEGEAANAMVCYHLAYWRDKMGDSGTAQIAYELAARTSIDRIFPHRLEEIDVLRRATAVDPKDAHAWPLLGTLLAALRRPDEALDCWHKANALQPDAVTYRNIGQTLWEAKGDLPAACDAYHKALAYNKDDYRLFADLSDLMEAMGGSPAEREELLRAAPQHGRIQARLVEALNGQAKWDEAIAVLEVMQFDPYEGERGSRPAYHNAYLGRGLARYEAGDLSGALADLRAALEYPLHIGVGKSHFAQDSKALYWAGVVSAALDDEEGARGYWEQGAAIRQQPRQVPESPKAGYDDEALHYKSLCLQRLGRGDEAARLF